MAVIYAFVVLVDPFDILPLSPPAERVPVASNARFAFPSLARSDRFDSAVFGTSTSRLLRPVVLNAEFGAHFANLAMNAATAYEQSRLMAVFRAAHRDARVVLVGIDIAYCEPGETEEKFTPRYFPEWMYDGGRWRGYREMFNLYAVQEAGQEFGVLTRRQAPDIRQRRLYELRAARQRRTIPHASRCICMPRSRSCRRTRRTAIPRPGTTPGSIGSMPN